MQDKNMPVIPKPLDHTKKYFRVNGYEVGSHEKVLSCQRIRGHSLFHKGEQTGHLPEGTKYPADLAAASQN